MDVDKNYELNEFLGRILEEWRIFNMMKEIPEIEANVLPWLYALWLQVGVLFLFLMVTFALLKKESIKLNKEAISERSDSVTPSKMESRAKPTHEAASIKGLHAAVKKYYIEKDLVSRSKDSRFPGC